MTPTTAVRSSIAWRSSASSVGWGWTVALMWLLAGSSERTPSPSVYDTEPTGKALDAPNRLGGYGALDRRRTPGARRHQRDGGPIELDCHGFAQHRDRHDEARPCAGAHDHADISLKGALGDPHR